MRRNAIETQTSESKRKRPETQPPALLSSGAFEGLWWPGVQLFAAIYWHLQLSTAICGRDVLGRPGAFWREQGLPRPNGCYRDQARLTTTIGKHESGHGP